MIQNFCHSIFFNACHQFFFKNKSRVMGTRGLREICKDEICSWHLSSKNNWNTRSKEKKFSSKKQSCAKVVHSASSFLSSSSKYSTIFLPSFVPVQTCAHFPMFCSDTRPCLVRLRRTGTVPGLRGLCRTMRVSAARGGRGQRRRRDSDRSR